MSQQKEKSTGKVSFLLFMPGSERAVRSQSTGESKHQAGGQAGGNMGTGRGGTKASARGAHVPLGPLLTLEEAAEYLRVSVRTMRSIRQRGLLPVARVSSGRIAFRRVDLDKYIEDSIEWPRRRRGKRRA